MSDVTEILSEIEGRNTSSAAKFSPLIYSELRRLAAQKLLGESPDHTLQATALVHEAYLRLADVDRHSSPLIALHQPQETYHSQRDSIPFQI